MCLAIEAITGSRLARKYYFGNGTLGQVQLLVRCPCRFSAGTSHMKLFYVLAAMLSFPLTTTNAAPRPFSADDLMQLLRISEPAVAPNGRYVAFTVRTTDLAADRGRTDIWFLDLKAPNTAPKKLTTHPENDSSAAWSSDSRYVYFASTRSGSNQVWRVAIDGGEAQQVTTLPIDINNFLLSPDNSRLAVSLDVFRDCDDLACTVERNKQFDTSKANGRVYDRIFVRHWDSWDEGRQSQLFVLNLDDGLAGDTPRNVSKPLDADVPSKPFGDASEYRFTPDSKHIVFSARIKGKTEPWSTNFDLYETTIDAATAPRNLTADNPAWDTQPVFSPNGEWLAWRAMQRPGFESDRFQIQLLNRKTGQRKSLTSKWDASIATMAFASDSKSIYVTADHLGQHPLWSIDIRDGKATRLTEAGHVDSFSVGGNQLVYALANLQSPAELFALRGNASQSLTQINAAYLSNKQRGSSEQFTFAGANDQTVYAHIVQPANFEANKKYPVAFFVHGGPQVSYGNAWSFRWNPQTYAGAGYAFIAIDFHGSPGYGQAFTDSISGDWGGKPLIDLQKGLTAALQKYPWLDANRICALGASYGGYMMNWIAGVWPEPFKCIVNHAGIFDNRFMAYSTEELWFEEWEHGGPQYAVPQNYEKHNPINHVAQWRVPMLITAGQRDYRVPYSQSLAAFTALQRRGIPSRLLMFPNENHWVLKPSNSLQWHREVESWLKQWIGE
jgi:dipeptidyl aminopeptidase/acylaminoacyl peptidase